MRAKPGSSARAKRRGAASPFDAHPARPTSEERVRRRIRENAASRGR